MIHAIVPQFFTADLNTTLTYYDQCLGFETQFIWGEPAVYAGAIRDGRSIFFRVTETPLPQPKNKYEKELLDAYIVHNDVRALYEDYTARGVEMHRAFGVRPWGFAEFVVRDCDGRLLCFGQSEGG